LINLLLISSAQKNVLWLSNGKTPFTALFLTISEALCQHLFLGKNLLLDDKTEGNVNPAKHFLREKMAQSRHTWRKNN
jgi:hypothetical protein